MAAREQLAGQVAGQLDLLSLLGAVLDPAGAAGSSAGSSAPARRHDSVHAVQRDSDHAPDRAWACSCAGAAAGLRVCVDGRHPAWLSPVCADGRHAGKRCAHLFTSAGRRWRPLGSGSGSVAVCSCSCHYPDGIGDPASSRELAGQLEEWPAVPADGGVPARPATPVEATWPARSSGPAEKIDDEPSGRRL